MEASVSCMLREAWEETGLALSEDDLSLVHVIDLLDPGSTIPRNGFFFASSRREEASHPSAKRSAAPNGTGGRWTHALPEPIVEQTRAAPKATSCGTLYTLMGWT